MTLSVYQLGISHGVSIRSILAVKFDLHQLALGAAHECSLGGHLPS
jgi:hypothetical protein